MRHLGVGRAQCGAVVRRTLHTGCHCTFHGARVKASGAQAQPFTETPTEFQALEQLQATPATMAASPLLNTDCYLTSSICCHHRITPSGLVPCLVFTRIRCNFGTSPIPRAVVLFSLAPKDPTVGSGAHATRQARTLPRSAPPSLAR